jgi:type I restriction enzyme S subunit
VALTRCQIKDLGRVVTGHTPPTKDRTLYGNSYPLIKPTDMSPDERYIGETMESLSESGSERYKSYVLPPDTPCVVTIGTIGKLCLARQDSFCNQAVNAIIVDRTRHNPLYVYYLMRLTVPRVKALSSGTASGRENVSKGVFESIEIDVHALSVQDRIVSILSPYDDLIENNARRIMILEETAKMIYREWFVNFRFPGHEKVNIIESGTRRIPDGWDVVALQDVAGVNEQSLQVGNGIDEIVYIDIASVSTANIDSKVRMDFDQSPSRARRIVRHGDIIWSTVRPNRRSYALILEPEPNLIVSTGFAVLTAHAVPYSYLYFATTTDAFAEYLANHATGSAYPAVNAGDFENAQLLKPPAPLLNQFHEIAADMMNLRHCLHLRNLNLRRTRDLLLPKLISGEVSVERFEKETVGQGI